MDPTAATRPGFPWKYPSDHTIPLEQQPESSPNYLFIANALTPFYLRDRQCPDPSQLRILDVGCGTGYKTLSLAIANPHSQILAVDASPTAVATAQARSAYHGLGDRIQFQVLELNSLDQLGLHFDYIQVLDALDRVPDAGQFLSVLRRCLNPQGLIRIRVKSWFQQILSQQAHAFLKSMGLWQFPAETEAVAAVENLIQNLVDSVLYKKDLSQKRLHPSSSRVTQYEFGDGDRGYTLAELFTLLDQSDLQFVQMTNWMQWQLDALFRDRTKLSSFWQTQLSSLALPDQLLAIEQLNPQDPDLDFWCSHPATPTPTPPLLTWNHSHWQRASVQLHPQLATDAFWTAVKTSIQTHQPFDLADFLNHNLPLSTPYIISSEVALAILLPLASSSQSVSYLGERWLQLQPVDPITLERLIPEVAFQKIQALLSPLADRLYIFLTLM